MKKTIFFNTLFLSALMLIMAWGIAQTPVTIYSEDVGTPTETTTVHTYTGWSNTSVTYTGDGTCDVRTTSPSTTDNYATASGSGNIMINNAAKWLQISGINTSGYTDLVLHFGLRKAANAVDGSTFKVGVSTNGTQFTELSLDNLLPIGSGTSKYYYVTISTGIPVTTTLTLKFYETVTTDFRIDDILLTGIASGTTPPVCATPTITPAAGFYTSPQNITLSCDTAAATIRYTLDGTNPVSTSTLYTAPFQLDTTATVKARAWKVGLDSSAVATAIYTFPIEVPNIAAFIAANSATNTTIYKITGDVTFIYRNARNIYVQDATGGMLIYDNTAPIITTTYNSGDVISGGIIGTYTLYNGLSELIPTQNTNTSTINNGAITPVTATFAELLADQDTYMSRLVKVENILFDNGSFNTSSATNITIRQAGDSLILRNSFRTVTLDVDAGDMADVVGLLAINNNNLQLYPRDNDDITILTPLLDATPKTLLVSNTEAATFTVTAANLTNAIDITSTNPDFQVNPATLPASTTSSTVDVTFSGTANTTGQIIVTSGTLSDTVNVTGEIYVTPIDTIIYATGFEADEGFEVSTIYNSPTISYKGPENFQWGTIYGTPSTTGPITGLQSMQMRWYTNAATTLGSTETNFDLHNVTKVTFKAKNTVAGAGLNVTATYSIDGGNTWIGDSTYILTLDATDYAYFITDSGQYYNVRLKFQVALQENNPTGTVRVVMDEVKVYGVLGLEPTVVETPVISPNSGNYFTPQSVSITCATENAEIRYTLDGSDPVITSTLYTVPFTVDTTTVVKAKGFKAGYDASNMATATYTFPVEVPNIAAWKAANSANNNTPYTITGDITFVFKNGSNSYIEDATGGLLIYDNTTVITETYTEGDVISGGITGRCQMYNGMRELIPLLNTAPATINNGTVTPVVLTAAALETNSDEYESRLVRINQVTFAAGEFNTAGATSINFTQDETELIARNSFKTLDMTIEEGTNADIIGFVAIYNGDVQLYPRDNDDIIIVLDTVAMPYFRVNGISSIFENGDTIYFNGVFEPIYILSNTEDALIYYTTDESEPTVASTLYTAPVANASMIKAIAVKEDMINSAVSTVYIIVTGDINSVNQDLVSVYPNPAQSFIQLNNLFEVQAQAVALYNAQGQLIGKYAVTNNNAEISLSGMASGTYFIQIATPKGNIVKKVTKH